MKVMLLPKVTCTRSAPRYRGSDAGLSQGLGVVSAEEKAAPLCDNSGLAPAQPRLACNARRSPHRGSCCWGLRMNVKRSPLTRRPALSGIH